MDLTINDSYVRMCIRNRTYKHTVKRGRYELLWGHRLLEEGPDHLLKDIGIVNDTELTLGFVPDAPPASPRG